MRDEIIKYFISSSGNIKTLISNISLINTIEKSVNLITDSLLDSKCLFVLAMEDLQQIVNI